MTARTHQQHRMPNLIKMHQSSNLSITDFCKKHKIHKWTFWYWRKKLNNSEKLKSKALLRKVQKSQAFLPVVVSPQTSAPHSEKIEIHYPSGISMTFPTSFDLNRLNRFIEKGGI